MAKYLGFRETDTAKVQGSNGGFRFLQATPTGFSWYWDSFDDEIEFMKKNVAGQVIGRQMITISDGSDFTGSVSVFVTVDGGTQGAGGGTVTHEGNGYHTYAPTQAETNGDHIAFTFTAATALTRSVDVYTNFPQSVDNNTEIVNNGNAIAALNDFNPATDTVANVTTVQTTVTNTDMRGTDNALLAASYTAPDNTTISDTNTKVTSIQGNYSTFNPATDAVANVTLVDTCTTNTDMRGTDGANTIAPDNATISDTNTRVQAIQLDYSTLTASDILTTQLTESYSADGVEFTLTQALYLISQNLQDFNYAGTTQTVRRIDGSTTAATYTLDDAVSPTSKTRAS